MDDSTDFLNNKKTPTAEQIMNYFFSDLTEMGKFINMNNQKEIDYVELGEPDDMERVSGTEWAVIKSIWKTSMGVICKINLIKLNSKLDELFPPNLFKNNDFYPINLDNITDIDYEDVDDEEDFDYNELLEMAIEDENYEEAARLRDWNVKYLELLKSLKTTINDAIENEDINTLNVVLAKIAEYKKTL